MNVQVELMRTQLDRILSSKSFAEAERAQKFLRFVVELALAGREREIKESVIGVEVLGRSPSYDPRTDPIVRVEAGRLRARLTSYYESEGNGDNLLVELPKGAYVPHFSERRLPFTKPKRMHPVVILAGGTLIGFFLAWTALSYFRRIPSIGEPARLLSVLPPEGTQLELSSISPDGHYVAFTAKSQGMTRLWIRGIDSINARALPGTEYAAYPFWSPDSRSIGFFSPGKLKKIQFSGGPAQEICEVQAPFGGTWGTRGVIVFAQRPSGILYQVPADGGVPKPVSWLDGARGEVAHLFPAFLPDGLHFLYSVISAGVSESALRVGSLDSKESKFMLHADLGAAYAPAFERHPASLVFAYRGALMSQPFDAQRLELTSKASMLAPQVRHVAARTDVSVSSNGVLAYQGRSENDRQLTWFDRSGKVLGTIGPRNNYQSLNLSRDDNHLAIENYDPASGRAEIWTMDLRRESLSRIETKVAETFDPVWSPDASELLFSEATQSGLRLVRQAVDKPRPVPLLDSEGVKVASDWSADGKFIAYSTSWPDFKRMTVWVIPTSGAGKNSAHSFSTGDYSENCASFSPVLSTEGPRWIAYSSNETGRDEVYVKTFPAGDRKWKISSGGGWSPHWRRDGRELFYLAPGGELMAVDIKVSSGFQSGASRALFQTGIPSLSFPQLPPNSYAVGKDGNRFLINRNVNGIEPESISVYFLARP